MDMKQRFPGSEELRAYFQHVAEVWVLRKDTEFNSFVSSAAWGEDDVKWTVKTNTGATYKVEFLLLSTGFVVKRVFQRLDCVAVSMKPTQHWLGTFLYPSDWPHEEPDFRGKNVAVVATGIQLAQELSKVAAHLTVFQRTLNMSLPMGQVNYELPQQAIPKPDCPKLFAEWPDSFSGFSSNFLPRSTFDDRPEQRLKTYEELWKQGDFKFWLATYNDMLFTQEGHCEAFNFWRDKTSAKISEPKVVDILAPMEQPYAFGCKRISLYR
ncbi:hypothetical protein GGP41_003927 [Bipolaris sorokiniana]|uniref:FAD/NAD(P)-binding domain-containing protein n=1 Tax=Cochliobolus sativus TaxID=45130 RepID=A0A8H6DYE6_COCSA|nr:hypothetical protein GGP41_003927 [Bipolaris sorokiniana]